MPGDGGRQLPPKVFSVAAEEPGGGVPLWVLPLAGVALAGAGMLTMRLS